MKPLYKRILLKLSGEGLMGTKDFGISAKVIADLAKQIKAISGMGVSVSVVVGGGNIFRGAAEDIKGLDRSDADYIGMLSTVMNGLVLKDALEKQLLNVRVLSGLDIPKVCEPYIHDKAVHYFNHNKVLIFVGGTGNPFFTTDTGAVLRAAEMRVDAVLKATQVDGVYSSDPKKDKNAKRFDKITYDEVITRGLNVMDMAAVALAKENRIPLVVFSQEGKDALVNAVRGKGKFTLIK